jgi:hypothetical protein
VTSPVATAHASAFASISEARRARAPAAYERLEQREPVHRDEDPRPHAEQRHEQALDHELARDPEARSAERRAHGELAPARRRPRQQQPRDVGAGDQQDGGRGEREDQQRPARVAGQLLAQRQHVRREIRRLTGSSRTIPRVTRSISACACSRVDPRLQAADDREVVGRARCVLFRAARRGHPQPHVALQELKAARHHADDLVGARRSGAASGRDARLAAEAAEPEAMAQDRDVSGARRVLVAPEHAAERGRDAEHLEEIPP